jgi:hypothetical protein
VGRKGSLDATASCSCRESNSGPPVHTVAIPTVTLLTDLYSCVFAVYLGVAI